MDVKYISEYMVGYVPLIRATYNNTDDFYERKEPGLYPDMPLKRKTNAEIENDGFWAPRLFEQEQEHLLTINADSFQSLWFTVNEKGEDIKAGNYSITVYFYSANSNNC